ncbi:HelD family protein [Streptomyces sp. NPDC056390]|uniref:HelD family protein n=1 Tax=Streptomyces sp. NPDC056390 TaxID=3345806 RepID=UPI0035DAF41F
MTHDHHPEVASAELATEQQHLDLVYTHLDAQRARLADDLRTAFAPPGGGHAARTERDTIAAERAAQAARLEKAENGLCFGRLDLVDGESRYVGRLGVTDEHHEPVLLDWRTPAARPFYLATALHPDSVVRRRHLRTRARHVTGLNDEILDSSRADTAAHRGAGPANESALLVALNAPRTGRMRSIVETIQTEQDAIIRSPHRGVLVVDGGPGTGKTAVALHRAAYLLYTHREQLARRGVLVIGPGEEFLQYIEQVLPSLGEGGVLLSTISDLYGTADIKAADAPEAAALKGSAAMADVLSRALANRQGVLHGERVVRFAGHELILDASTAARAAQASRDTGLPHNLCQEHFLRHLATALASSYLAAAHPHNEETPDAQDVVRAAESLADSDAVRAVVRELWPRLTPERLLADLYSEPEILAAAAPGLSPVQRNLLQRTNATDWTAADMPLLDEIAEALGQDETEQRRREAAAHQQRVQEAQMVLDTAYSSRSIDLDAGKDRVSAFDIIDAEGLAERFEERDHRSVAERARADRTWVFGHVIVDEAQELSAMAWRMVMRRCPGRWMTLVGDTAQTSDPAGTASWAEALDPHVGGRWRLERLSVNYRTTAPLARLAADALAAIDPRLEAPTPVRSDGTAPWHERVSKADLHDRLGQLARQEERLLEEGRLAIIVPNGRLTDLGPAVQRVLPDATIGQFTQDEDVVAVMEVQQTKGLEFDSVLVVEPADIATAPRGANDLYVAVTRATQRLGLLHTSALPHQLSRVGTGH